jgi:hypothetical protein
MKLKTLIKKKKTDVYVYVMVRPGIGSAHLWSQHSGGARGSWVRDQSRLQSKFQDSLGCMVRHCLKKTKKMRKKQLWASCGDWPVIPVLGRQILLQVWGHHRLQSKTLWRREQRIMFCGGGWGEECYRKDLYSDFSFFLGIYGSGGIGWSYVNSMFSFWESDRLFFKVFSHI